MSATHRLTVALGDRAYDILIGPRLIADAGAILKERLAPTRVVTVVDETVAGLHLAALQAGLDAAGVGHRTVTLPPGEATKDLAHYGRLTDAILDFGIDRRTTLLALGGGVIGDLTGFAAATLLRGLDFVQIPTTLLAQVDSSVGGKTAIDTRQGKNLIGAFHQPRLVLADTACLATLPVREWRAGYAELVKIALIKDPGFFDHLERIGPTLMQDRDALSDAIRIACRMKAETVAADEKETGERALLNLGHTFGHALEVELGYGGELLHGEAVSIGIVLAFELSVALGLCPAEDAARARRHLASMGLPVDIPRSNCGWTAERLLAHMRKDKKVTDGRITFILTRGIGKAFIATEIAPAAVSDLLERRLAA
jgi:3-dehydroquinate synthase